jgi:hypothetical protein
MEIKLLEKKKFNSKTFILINLLSLKITNNGKIFINMKKLFCLLSLFAMSYVSFAQPTEAEDFTITDLDGVEHNLFTYLDAGKHVYIEFILAG